MKSPDEIVDGIAQNIADIYMRPQMHVGNVRSPYTPYAVCTVLWSLHWHWAKAYDRNLEFRQTVDAVREQANCGSLDFADAFRDQNPDASHEECSRFVMRQWKVISDTLSVPLVDLSGQEVTDADL